MPSPTPPLPSIPATHVNGERAFCSKFGLIILLTTGISQTTTLFVHLTTLSHYHHLGRCLLFLLHLHPAIPSSATIMVFLFSHPPPLERRYLGHTLFPGIPDAACPSCSHIIPIHPRTAIPLRVHNVRPGIPIGAYRVRHAHYYRSAPPFFLL